MRSSFAYRLNIGYQEFQRLDLIFVDSLWEVEFAQKLAHYFLVLACVGIDVMG